MKNAKTDDFDGHLEKPISEMTPREKLIYLSAQIELRRYVREHVRKIPKDRKD
jgi:hypothetical protein